MEIGGWARRSPGPGARDGVWHRIESIVADAAFTHCGRRLEPLNSNGPLDIGTREFVPVSGLVCKRCA